MIALFFRTSACLNRLAFAFRREAVYIRIFTPNKLVRLLAAPVCLVTGASNSFAAEANKPVWAEEALYLYYDFPTDDPHPMPTRSYHPHGVGGLAASVIVDSRFGHGWWNPDDYPRSFTREATGGSWDLGQGGLAGIGRIEILMPLNEAFFPGAEAVYGMELWVNVVRYSTVGGVPTFSTDAEAISTDSISDVFLETRIPEGGGFLDSWNVTTWRATVPETVGGALTVTLHAHPMLGSIIDSVEIWAHPVLIAEPHARMTFGLAALATALAVRSRSRLKPSSKT